MFANCNELMCTTRCLWVHYLIIQPATCLLFSPLSTSSEFPGEKRRLSAKENNDILMKTTFLPTCFLKTLADTTAEIKHDFTFAHLLWQLYKVIFGSCCAFRFLVRVATFFKLLLEKNNHFHSGFLTLLLSCTYYASQLELTRSSWRRSV